MNNKKQFRIELENNQNKFGNKMDIIIDPDLPISYNPFILSLRRVNHGDKEQLYYCGYVGLKRHLIKNIKDEDSIIVHGGITWSANNEPSNLMGFSNKWAFYGFDCTHSGDAVRLKDFKYDNKFRTHEFVWNEVTNMYKQIRKNIQIDINVIV